MINKELLIFPRVLAVGRDVFLGGAAFELVRERCVLFQQERARQGLPGRGDDSRQV